MTEKDLAFLIDALMSNEGYLVVTVAELRRATATNLVGVAIHTNLPEVLLGPLLRKVAGHASIIL